MLPPKYRLSFCPQKGQKKVNVGVRYQGPFFGFVVRQLPASPLPLNVSQFGFVISKKIAQKAVVRNRIKRLLAEALWRFIPKIKPGFGIVVLGKKALVGEKLEPIAKEMERLLEKAQLLET